MRHWRTTGNSNVAVQTGSTYISDSMTDIIIIPTANLGFSMWSSSQKVSTVNKWLNIERQPEIAIWPPKSETTGITTENVEIPTASTGFSTMASPNKVWQVIATITVNRKQGRIKALRGPRPKYFAGPHYTYNTINHPSSNHPSNSKI